MGIPAAQALAWVWNAVQPQRAKTPRSGNTLNPQGFAKNLAKRFVANAVSGLPGAIPTVRRMMRCSSVILFIVVLIAASQSRSDLKYCTLHAVSSACSQHTVWLATPDGVVATQEPSMSVCVDLAECGGVRFMVKFCSISPTTFTQV